MTKRLKVISLIFSGDQLKIIEDLEVYKQRQSNLEEIKDLVKLRIFDTLYAMERNNTDREAELIQDTYISSLVDEFGLSEREAFLLVKKLINEEDQLKMDGTVIGLKYKKIQCTTCGCSYSSILQKCPGCIT